VVPIAIGSVSEGCRIGDAEAEDNVKFESYNYVKDAGS
jgi:hypothetical protein